MSGVPASTRRWCSFKPYHDFFQQRERGPLSHWLLGCRMDLGSLAQGGYFRLPFSSVLRPSVSFTASGAKGSPEPSLPPSLPLPTKAPVPCPSSSRLKLSLICITSYNAPSRPTPSSVTQGRAGGGGRGGLLCGGGSGSASFLAS